MAQFWRRPPPPARPPAVFEVIADGEDFANTPLGGWGGEQLPRPEPAPPPPAAIVIPPPEWAGREGELHLGRVADLPPDTPDALTAMKAADGYEPPEFAVPCPPLEPLQRPEFPTPDWRQEETQRAEQAVTELEGKSLLPYPAPPREKGKS